ncbi:MAG TPA: DUF892 family protein [Abditibacteriaceae bacterium]|jgi:ferritin-like metal-binding protein YciE
MAVNTLDELFAVELQELLSSEQLILQTLPQMAQMASTPELQQALQEHEAQTRGQVQRLEQIFQQMGQSSAGGDGRALQALISQAQEKLQQIEQPAVRDAFMIAAQQKVEHFEISCYGTARSHALQLNNTHAADLLQATLEEEEQTDQRLSRLAENRVNDQADPQHVQGS